MEVKSEKSSATHGIESFLASHYTLGCVLLLALALRVAHVFSLRSLPFFNSLWLDSEVYDQWARRIAAGDWLGGDRAFFMDPLYSYVLAVVYKIFGHDLLVVRLLQAGLGAGTCALVAFIGYRVTRNRAIGTLGAFFMAVYGPAIFQEGEIEKTVLGVFLITAALAFAITKRGIPSFLAGVFLALASLTRGNLLLLAPLGMIYFFVSPAEQAEHNGESCCWREWFSRRAFGKEGRNTLCFFLGSFLVLSVPLLRNHHVSGEWIVITSMSGPNFYTGNNPYNNVGAYKPLPFVRPQSLNEEPDFLAMAEAKTGTKLSRGEMSSFWFREGLKHVVENPMFAASVFAKKFCLFWSNVEIADAWDYYFFKRFSPALNLPLLNFSTLLMFAAVGVVSFYKRYSGAKLLIGYVAAYSVTVIAFFIFSRYRIHVVPPLAVLSSFGLLWTWEKIRQHGWKTIVPNVVVGVMIFTFSYGASLTFGFDATESVNSYTLLAELYRKRGDFSSAESFLKEALQKYDNDPSTLQALGLLYATKKDPQNTFYYFDQCVRKDEAYPDALFFLGIAQESLGKIPEAIGSYKKQLEYIPNHEPSKDRLLKLTQGR